MSTSDALDDCGPFLGCKRQAPGTDFVSSVGTGMRSGHFLVIN